MAAKQKKKIIPGTELPEQNTEEKNPPLPEKYQSIEKKSETEAMDTHAQHLHKAPGKKGWHYFFEFLMLFFAVTLGFFVENLREKYIENQRAQEYARSLYDDLRIDTTVIQRTINEKNWIAAKYDSATAILASGKMRENNGFMYYAAWYLMFNDAFTSQNVTYEQLRSSGNFRYINNLSLYKEIANYYNLYSRYQLYDIYGQVKDSELTALLSDVYNVNDFWSLHMQDNFTFYDLQRPSSNLHPVAADVQQLRKLYFKFAQASESARGSAHYLNWLKISATNLINNLKKEYHLE